MQKLDALWQNLDGLFWLIVGGAILIKIMLSEKAGWKQIALTAITSVFGAALFTEPVLDLLKLDGEIFGYAVAGILALSGENIMRRILKYSKNGKIPHIDEDLS